MHGRKLETLTRLGFAARGIMYVLIGLLALATGRAEDGAGAMEYLGSGPGKILLGLMAIGFVAYGLWRLADAWLDSEGHGSDGKGMALRAGAAASGIIHLGLAYYAARLASGNGGQGSGEGTQQGAATALSLPGGQTLVALAAAALLLVGIYQLVKAAKVTFLRHMDGEASRRPWVRMAGRLGYAARGIVFLIMAYFFFRAATEESAGQAGGMGEALASLPGTVQLVVAFGLLLFGLFSFVEAKHRRISDSVGIAAGRAREVF
ncbi:MAG TPA: DUF1206 domain-containing protein [Allosphingosinicella sp.]|uniref:DUF1206 domain-containing protein n=1 Tax=Allosphingosinicella sp. TaxID=2823234 RepID=UPI002ED9B483